MERPSPVNAKKLYWVGVAVAVFLVVAVFGLRLFLWNDYSRDYAMKDSPSPARLDARNMLTVPFDERPNEPWYGRKTPERIHRIAGSPNFAVVPVDRAMRLWLKKFSAQEAGDE